MECRTFSDVCRCMKARKEGVAIWRLDEKRYAISVDQVIRYVGSQEECQRRAEILLPKDSRKEQRYRFDADQATNSDPFPEKTGRA